MPVRELAATILPLLSSSTPLDEREAMDAIVSWFRTGSTIGAKVPISFTLASFLARFNDPDYVVVAEAMQVLERAGLLRRALYVSDYSNFYVGLTRLGRHALQTNTVRQHLGLDDAAPAQ